MDTEKENQQKDDGHIGQQAAELAKLYSDYKAYLPAPGRDELLQRTYGAKAMMLFKLIDAHPEAQKSLHDYHERELQHEQMATIKAWDDGPPLTNKNPADLFLAGLRAEESAFFGALFGFIGQHVYPENLEKQVQLAQLGVTFEAGLSSIADISKAKVENELFGKVTLVTGERGIELYAKGVDKSLDHKLFEPLGHGVPGHTSSDPRPEQTYTPNNFVQQGPLIPNVPEHPTGPDAGIPPVPEHPMGPDAGIPPVPEHPNALASYDPGSNAAASHGSAHDALASYDPGSNAAASHGSAHDASASYDPGSNAAASYGSAHDASASHGSAH